MKISFRTPPGVVALAVLLGFVACKSSMKTLSSPGDGGGGGGEAAVDEATGGAGQTAEAGANGQAGEAATGGDGNRNDVQRGEITLTQANVKSEALMLDTANYDLAAGFATHAELSREQAAASVTTVGDCTASVVTIDPKAPRVMRPSGLNAGPITVTGIRMPPTLLIDYTDNGATGPSDYKGVRGDTRFFEDGDVLSVRGAGGPDLPAFKVESLKAPSEITVTAPSCVTGSCPDIDHTQDLLFTWENGGDGKVNVLFETVADAQVVLLECKFDAAGGKGTVPSALLSKLDIVDGENVSGIEQITPIDEVTFLVGDVSTTFSIRLAQFEALLGP
jgi:hypothetical protein